LHWGIVGRLYLASLQLIAALVLVANAAWIRLTTVNDLSRHSAVNSGRGPDQQALAQVGLPARGARTRVAIDKTDDEFHPLLLALRSMQSALMNVVRNVRHGAESVAAASVEIAQGNRDLSRRPRGRR